MPNGSWQRKELPGPPFFEVRWASFRVYRTTLLLSDVAPPEILDNYGKMVRSQPFCTTALGLPFATLTSGCVPSNSVTSPLSRGTVFAVAVAEKSGMKTCTGPPSSTSLASSRLLLQWKMTLRSLLWSAAVEPPQGQGPGKAHATHASCPQKSQGSSASVYSRKGKFCDETNSTAGCPRSTSECPGLHAGKVCKVVDHGMQGCSSPGSGTPPPPPPPTGQKKRDKAKGQKEQD